MASKRSAHGGPETSNISVELFGVKIEARPFVVAIVIVIVLVIAGFWYQDAIKSKLHSFHSSSADFGKIPRGMTLSCQYSEGPQSGHVQDFYGIPGVTPTAIGGPCSDGFKSTGTAVYPAAADEIDDTPIPAGAEPPNTVCQFTYGPKRGGWHDYAPLPPLVIGSACQDAAGSAGLVVRTPHGKQY